jgi:hypothetical protein
MSITHIRKRYLWQLAATFFGAIIATGLINLVIDPYGTFRLIDIRGLNHIKPYPDHDIETIKAHALRHLSPDALILGNSRAEVGFDPTHPAWQATGYRSVYNAAIAGTSPSTAWKQLEKVAQRQPPKFILLAIDFFDFPIDPDKKTATASKPSNTWLSDARWALSATLTMQAMIDSAATVRRQIQNNPQQLTMKGFNPLLEYKDIAKIEGYWSLFRQRLEDNAKNHSRKPANLYLRGTQSSPTLDDIRQIVSWSVANDTELKIVIYPYHAQLLLLIDEIGLWPTFEEWKRQILRITTEESLKSKNSNVTLIDFSGFSEFSQETIPSKQDKTVETKWYWEAGHFKKELGDHILSCCIFQNSDSATGKFGVSLNTENIETEINRIRLEKSVFILDFPMTKAEVADIVHRQSIRPHPILGNH